MEVPLVTEENHQKQANKEMNDTKENEEMDIDETVEVIDADNEKNEDFESKILEELEALKQEKENTENRLLRVQAEYDNFKKRTQKEREAERKYKAQDLVSDLLPVLDNFERALQVEKNDATSGLIDGVSMVYRQLEEAIQNNGVEVIDTEGKEFDPNLHHAVMQAEDEEFESNFITEELQKGYILKDRVIRPAMVKVNK